MHERVPLLSKSIYVTTLLVHIALCVQQSSIQTNERKKISYWETAELFFCEISNACVCVCVCVCVYAFVFVCVSLSWFYSWNSETHWKMFWNWKCSVLSAIFSVHICGSAFILLRNGMNLLNTAIVYRLHSECASPRWTKKKRNNRALCAVI